MEKKGEGCVNITRFVQGVASKEMQVQGDGGWWLKRHKEESNQHNLSLSCRECFI